VSFGHGIGMRVMIDLVSIIRQANLATDGTRKCVVSGSLK